MPKLGMKQYAKKKKIEIKQNQNQFNSHCMSLN